MFERAGMVGYLYIAYGFQRIAIQGIHGDHRFSFNLARNGKLMGLCAVLCKGGAAVQQKDKEKIFHGLICGICCHKYK